MNDDDDHLRDTPDLPGGREFSDDEAYRREMDRRTPILRPLMRTDIERWDDDLV